jgi:gamma-glutamyltranspeptidase/glutathione hydrolase
MNALLARRDFLKLCGTAALGSFVAPQLFAADDRYANGLITGETHGELAGLRVLQEGGNAIDAAVAGALVAAITSPEQTGIGGYGMHAVVAMDGGKRIVTIDGNGTAPAALTNDLFKPGPTGKVGERDKATGWMTSLGWMTVGVPGMLGGLQLVLDQCGTRKFGELALPAIKLCRDGFEFPGRLTEIIGRSASLRKDPGSNKLYFRDGEPIQPGVIFKNPELAELLETLAKANSVEAFYRGDIALRIAEGFAKNGGLVTAQDLAAYRARVVEPVTADWGEHKFFTAPPSAGGLTSLQMLCTLRALNWDKLPEGVMRTQLRVEAMRLAWRDRLPLRPFMPVWQRKCR